MASEQGLVQIAIETVIEFLKILWDCFKNAITFAIVGMKKGVKK